MPAAACVLLVTVGLAPASAAQPARARAARARAARASEPDLQALRAAARRALGAAGARSGARGRFVVAPLVRSTDVSAADAAAVGPPEQLTVGPAIARAYVSWQPPSDTGGEPVTGYRVYRGQSSTSLAPIGTTTGTAILNRGLALSATYYFAVAAVTASGEGERSAAVPVTIPRRELIMSVPTSDTSSALVAQARRGAPLVPILDDGHDNHSPAVSPDGKWLAYVTGMGGQHAVFVRRADGSGTARRIVAGPDGPNATDLIQQSWSPDGKWLVVTEPNSDWSSSYAVRLNEPNHYSYVPNFESGSWSAGASVVGVNSETGALVEEYFSVSKRRTVKSNARALDADVSPDGEWVAFSHVDGEAFGFPVTSIQLVSRHGGPATVLATPGGINTDIAWSRRGSRLYFTHVGFDSEGVMQPATILTVNKDGSGLTPAGPDAVESYGPAHREVLAPPRATAPKPPAVIPDFDGDGGHDLGVFRPSNGTWYVRGMFTVKFGRAGDVPVPADFNGDKRSEVAVWRPSTGMWHIRGMKDVRWGRRGDVPVPADYNGDGRDEIAVWRPSTGMWIIRGLRDVRWGRTGDIPFVGRWHSSQMEVAVWRPSTGTWYIHRTGGWPNKVIRFGRPGDVPVRSANIHGEGSHDLGIFRPSTGTYYQYEPRNNRRTPWSTKVFDRPAEPFAAAPLGWVWLASPGAYNGRDGLFQPTTGSWGTDMFIYGRRGDLPL